MKKLQYADSHAHLTSDELFPDIDPILERAQEAGVTSIINICTDLVTLGRGLELSVKYPWIKNVASTTPHDVDRYGELHFAEMEKAASNGALAAVGETGLDYHYNHSKPETQQKFLIKYAQLAAQCNLPLVIHCRDAFQDLFSLLKPSTNVILHCFTGTLEEAEEVVKRGWYLSLSGIVTFKKSEELRQVAKMVPLEQLLIETDAPYLAPGKQRGKRNEPAFLIETGAHISAVRNISVEALAEATTANTRKVFYAEN